MAPTNYLGSSSRDRGLGRPRTGSARSQDGGTGRTKSATPANPQDQAPPEPRTLAFLFADLRGYTRFIDEHGDAAAAELVSNYRAIVRETVGRYSGREMGTEGDSFFVVFESVSSAVRCGADILAATGRHDPPIRLGIGIHAGEAAAGERGYVAGPVNLAARLCAAARAGDLLITGTVRALTRSAVEVRFEPAGVRRLKGFDEPVELWRVDVPQAAKEPDQDLPSVRMVWLMIGAIALALAGGTVDALAMSAGPSVAHPPLGFAWPAAWVPASFVLAPFTFIADMIVGWSVISRQSEAARISTRALVVLAFVLTVAAPYFVTTLLLTGAAGELGGVFT